MTSAADRAAEPGHRNVNRHARLGAAAGVALALLAGAAQGQERAAIEIDSDDGFGRIVLAFDEQVPPHSVESSSGVVVIDFESAVDIDARALAAGLPDYIAVARHDPDGYSLRFALVDPVSVNTMVAGERLFLDLLPEGWEGDPPGLPQAVIDDLVRRAHEAEERRAARARARRREGAPRIDLRIATLPTFARLVFEWPEPADASIERGYDTVRLEFDAFAELETAGLGSRLPDYVTGLSAENGEDGLEVSLDVDPRVTVRGFREESTYVLDVSAPDSGEPSTEPSLPALAEAAQGGARFPGEADSRVSEPPEAESDAEEVTLEFTPLEAAERAEAAADAAEEAALEPATDWDAVVAEDPDAVRPEARHFDSSVRIVFPFEEETPSAVFHHAGALWLVFDTARAIDTRALAHELDGTVSEVEVLRLGEPAVLRLVLSRPMLTTVKGRRTNWVLTLGDAVLDPPSPLSMDQAVDSELGPVATIDLPGAGTAHRLRDEESGHRLVTVTARPPAHGVVKPHRLVEMTVLETRHGVAARRLADDLEVRIEEERVIFSRRGGLSVSAPDGDGGYQPGRLDADEVVRPGFVDISRDMALDPGLVHRLLNHRIRAAAEAEEGQRTPARLEFARALLATDLGAEALAQLRLIAAEDPAVLRDPEVRALRGVAKTLMHRPEEALREFDMQGLSDNPDIALWRGLAHGQAGDWRAAAEAFRAGRPALEGYGPERRRRFGLAAARAAIELGDTTTAAAQLAVLPETNDDDPEAEMLLLRGRLAEENGDADEALAAYDGVRQDGDRALAADASLRATVLRHRRGDLDADDAIDSLETLSVTWRGDDIELLTLRHLADLHVDQGNPRHAFELMEMAAVVDPASPITRALQDDMNVAFEALFLEGEADALPAVDALALYYDYRELTPIGRRGDEVIRRLAERLVDVDLLDQAAELLSHQVEHRLRGADRAQVAARLALVHLMNREPAEALDVLARTRREVLPREVMNERLEIEARALSETGRTDLALDILDRLDGEPGIDRLRADALWSGERWREAGESLEQLLVEAGAGDGAALDEPEALDVLRAGIAYALAEDRLGLDRLRNRFLARMADSAHARAFDVVTLGLPEHGGAFEALVRDIAARDSLDAFIAEYRDRHGGPIGEMTPPEG